MKINYTDETHIQKEIKQFCQKIKIQYINKTIFSSSKNFIESLEKGKSYFLITKELGKILYNKNDLKENEIEFSFNENDKSKIIFTFKNDDNIELKLKKDESNNDYIFDKNCLMEDKQKSKEKNNNNKSLINEILEKINSFQVDKDKSNKYYIISKEIKEYLKKLNQQKKDEKDKNENIDKIELDTYNKKILKNYNNTKDGSQISYFDEFILINEEIIELLETLGFNKEEIKKVKCYYIYEKEILIYNKDNKIQQIGNLVKDKIFKTTYLINKFIEDSIIKKIKEKKGIINYLNDKKIRIKKNYYELELNKDKNEVIYIYSINEENNTIAYKKEYKKKLEDNLDSLLSEFQNGLNILLSIISFQLTLKEKIENEKKYSSKCCLISKKWITEYKNFYLYNKLIEMLDEYFELNDLIYLSHDIKKIIFNNMFLNDNNKYDFRNNINFRKKKLMKYSQK